MGSNLLLVVFFFLKAKPKELFDQINDLSEHQEDGHVPLRQMGKVNWLNRLLDIFKRLIYLLP